MTRTPRPVPEFMPLSVSRSSPTDLLNRIEQCGIVGMGGAGFPTARKISIARNNRPTILVINAGCTDPQNNPDPTLLHDHGDIIRRGVAVLQRILNPERTVLALNGTLPLTDATAWRAADIEIHRLADRFPQGEEASVIDQSLGLTLPHGIYPAEVGVCVLNVATVFAVAEAVVLGHRPSDRLVSVNGRTVWVPFGTPMSGLMDGNHPIRIGGRWSGALARSDETVDSCLFAIWSGPTKPSRPCIRCGACDDACPLDLPVERLVDESMSKMLGGVSRTHLSHCYECGACVQACPSEIPVLDNLKDAKCALLVLERAESVAAVSLRRYERRLERIEREDEDSAKQRAHRLARGHNWEQEA